VDISKANVYISSSAGATVAQSVEHLTRNEDVRGSIPRGGSNKFKRLRALPVFPLPQKSPKSHPVTLQCVNHGVPESLGNNHVSAFNPADPLFEFFCEIRHAHSPCEKPQKVSKKSPSQNIITKKTEEQERNETPKSLAVLAC
jgi:hypothetical protein